MKFSQRSAETILSVICKLDEGINALDELPESEALTVELDQLCSIIARLDAITCEYL